MSMALTKEEIIEALNEGRITCNVSGTAPISPQKAREFLLANLDRLFDPRYKVDLSFEEKHAHILYGERSNPQKIASHKSHSLRPVRQNQHN